MLILHEGKETELMYDARGKGKGGRGVGNLLPIFEEAIFKGD